MEISLMRRMVAIQHDHPDAIYTVTYIKEQIESVANTKYPRNTYFVYFRRLCKMGISEKVQTNGMSEPAFRCASVFKAKSYLEGHYQDYTPGMGPTEPPIRPADSVRHRPVYKLQLSNSELEAVRTLGVWERFGRSPGYYRVNNKAFSLRAWSSGKARIFLKDDWREGLARIFDGEFIKVLEGKVASGDGESGWARKPPLEIPHLPVNGLAKVQSPDGKVTVFRYGYSQIKSGELDRHGPENEPYADMMEKWLYDELMFKKDIVNKFASLDRTLSTLPDEIGRAVAQAIKKSIESNNKSEEPYQHKVTKTGDYSDGYA